jgi:hypothetical protein
MYLFAEHLYPHAEPSQNAAAIKKLGDWIPGCVNFSHLKGSTLQNSAITQIYRAQGLNVEASLPGEEAGVLQMWQLLASN